MLLTPLVASVVLLISGALYYEHAQRNFADVI